MISEFTLAEKKEAKEKYKASLRKNPTIHQYKREELVTYLLSRPEPKKWQVGFKFFKTLY